MKKPLAYGALAVSLTVLGTQGFAARPAKPKPPAKGAKGDVKAGKALFLKRFPLECKACHKFGKDGGALGPELTHVGKKLKADKIKVVLKDPKKANPKSIMPPMKGTDKELTDVAAFLATQK